MVARDPHYRPTPTNECWNSTSGWAYWVTVTDTSNDIFYCDDYGRRSSWPSWDELLDFMWRLVAYWMRHVGSQERAPWGGRGPDESEDAPHIPYQCHGPILYWSGHVPRWPGLGSDHTRLPAVARLKETGTAVSRMTVESMSEGGES